MCIDRTADGNGLVHIPYVVLRAAVGGYQASDGGSLLQMPAESYNLVAKLKKIS